MPSVNIYNVLRTILGTIEPGNLSDDAVERLGTLFSEQLLLAALDLIDRDCVINLHQSCSIPFYCTCPAFAYAVLISHSQVTCKHVLATLIAQHLSKCVVREVNKDEFVTLLTRPASDR